MMVRFATKIPVTNYKKFTKFILKFVIYVLVYMDTSNH